MHSRTYLKTVGTIWIFYVSKHNNTNIRVFKQFSIILRNFALRFSQGKGCFSRFCRVILVNLGTIVVNIYEEHLRHRTDGAVLLVWDPYQYTVYPTTRLSLERLVPYRRSYSLKSSYTVKDNGIIFFLSKFPYSHMLVCSALKIE